ncbi:LptF/LptG family permease [Acidobacteriota bacterium]
MKIVSKYLVREISSPTAIGFMIYTFLLLMNVIVWLAEKAYEYDIDMSVIGQLFFLQIPSIIVLTLPMALLLGIMVGLGRMASDGEISALRASGVSLFGILRPIMIICTLFWGLNTYLMITVLPWGNTEFSRLFYEEVIARNITRNIKPKSFSSGLPGGLTLYAEQEIPPGDAWKNVFLVRRVKEGPDAIKQILVAERMHYVFDRNLELCWLDLTETMVYSIALDNPERSNFRQAEKFRISLPYPPQLSRGFRKAVLDNKGHRSQTLIELVESAYKTNRERNDVEKRQHRHAVLEIHKRFSIPFTCLVFGFVGVVAGIASRKGGKAFSFLASLAIFFFYYLCLFLGEKYALAGTISPFLGMWGANIIVGAVSVIAFYMKLKGRSMSGLLPWNLFISLVKRKSGEKKAGTGTAKLSASDHRVVIRIPRLHLAFPNTLDRYIASQYMRWFGRLLPSMLAIYILVTLFQLIYDFTKNDVDLDTILKLYKYWLPEMLSYALPLAAMVATLVTFSILTRTLEITAMRVSGISLYRIVMPVVLIGIGLTVVAYYLHNTILPQSQEKFNIYHAKVKGEKAEEFINPISPWAIGLDGQTFYNYGYFTPGRRLFEDIAVYQISPDFDQVERWTQARMAFWKGALWHARRGWTRTYSSDGVETYESFDEKKIIFTEDPSYFNRKWKPLRYMKYDELVDFQAYSRQKGHDTRLILLEMQNKMSWPSQTLIMVLIAIPFSLLIGRKGALTGVGVSIVIAIVYYACLHLFAYLGKVGILSPPVASWTPNLLFGVVAIYLLLTSRT